MLLNKMLEFEDADERKVVTVEVVEEASAMERYFADQLEQLVAQTALNTVTDL